MIPALPNPPARRLTIEQWEERQLLATRNVNDRWDEWNEAPSDYDGAETDGLIFALEQYRELGRMRDLGDI